MLHHDFGKVHEDATASLRHAKLTARNDGTLNSAVISAGFYAKKTKQTMYVYGGNSYMVRIYRVSCKKSEYLNAISNTDDKIIGVSPDLTVTVYKVIR